MTSSASIVLGELLDIKAATMCESAAGCRVTGESPSNHPASGSAVGGGPCRAPAACKRLDAEITEGRCQLADRCRAAESDSGHPYVFV